MAPSGKQTNICEVCKVAAKPKAFITCNNCNLIFHFSPCSSVSEIDYSKMSKEEKSNWKCHFCLQRCKSPNNLYQHVIYNDKNQQKQSRDDDAEDNENAKRFKETLSLASVNAKIGSFQVDVTTKINTMQTTMEQIAENMTSMSNHIRGELQTTLSTITTSLATLVTQVNELNIKDQKRESQINEMDSRINKLEQQLINRNIEIKNIPDTSLDAHDVMKKIAASLDVDISDYDISNAYRLKNKEKVIVEFSSLNKKRELMNKIKRHRVDANILKEGNSDFIYINDELTPYNRRLLWLAKTKATESKWSFVWVRGGNIFARKNEHSSAILIKNAADIETITI